MHPRFHISSSWTGDAQKKTTHTGSVAKGAALLSIYLRQLTLL